MSTILRLNIFSDLLKFLLVTLAIISGFLFLFFNPIFVPIIYLFALLLISILYFSGIYSDKLSYRSFESIRVVPIKYYSLIFILPFVAFIPSFAFLLGAYKRIFLG